MKLPALAAFVLAVLPAHAAQDPSAPATQAPARPADRAARPASTEFRRMDPPMLPGVQVAFPSLESWVQGEPVTGFEPGRVYVFEFFNTNCSHCAEFAELIHELARVNGARGARFVAISDEPAGRIREWLDKPGNRESMQYSIVSDPDRSAMNTFQNGTFRNFNPRFFVVKDGVVQWYGHPKDAEKPLEAIMSGGWDPAQARPAAIEDAQVALAKSRLDSMAVECDRAGDWSRMYQLLDSVIAAFPERAGRYKVQRATLMLGLGRQVDAGYEYARAVAKEHAGEMATMRGLARAALAAPYTQRRDVEFGLECALAADRLAEGKDALAADTLALAWFSKGDGTAAVEHQARAVNLETNMKQRRAYQRTLEQYRTTEAGPAPSKPIPAPGNAAPPAAPAE
jgi:thiol-disulfide isomerase/thioredoxin